MMLKIKIIPSTKTVGFQFCSDYLTEEMTIESAITFRNCLTKAIIQAKAQKRALEKSRSGVLESEKK